MLELNELTLRRGDLSWQHDFFVAPQQCVAVMGPSGSGKTTLLEALGGFVPIAGGTMTLQGQAMNRLPAEKRPVSTLFQDHNLFEHISVRHNLRLGFARGKPSSEQWQSVVDACDTLGMTHLIDRLPGELSGGQRQRIALIRTVLRPQPLILLDEPFSALDSHNRELAGNWLVEAVRAAQKMLIFVTHQPDDATHWADKTIQLSPV